MEETPIKSPEEYYKRYLQCSIATETEFVCMRVPVVKSAQLDAQIPVIVFIKNVGKNSAEMHIKEKNGNEKIVPLTIFEKLSWGKLEGSKKYLLIDVKGDKPIILYGATEVMEVWFDGLKNSQKYVKVETSTSKEKIEAFAKAIELSKCSLSDDNISIPAPPQNFDFHTKF